MTEFGQKFGAKKEAPFVPFSPYNPRNPRNPQKESVAGNSVLRCTSGSSSQARVREFAIEHDFQIIEDYYWDCFRREMVQPIKSLIMRCMHAGMEAPVIMNAIDETMYAENPTPRYMRAILQRYLGQGIFTGAQLLEDQDEFRRIQRGDYL